MSLGGRRLSSYTAFLAPRETIGASDLRNHGDSPHDPQHDYTVLAEDVEGFIDQHNLKDSTLIGHSMGAKTAMAVALRSPDRVANLIPVDNAPIDATLKSDFGRYIQGMRKIEDASVTSQREADTILKEFEEVRLPKIHHRPFPGTKRLTKMRGFANTQRFQSLPIRQFLLTNLFKPASSPQQRFRIPIKYLATALDNMGDFPFKDPDTARFEKPTLFVRGTKSHYVADEALPVIGRFFPRFDIRDIEAGHWVISEKPEDFRKVVVEFLQDKD
ncbi:MAG: hypothetical protein M1822_002132 [Bathelium mastoideum]|nr:MAG: hypothetical protein M1822_002132 [Bathelium mastoideum]